MGGNPLSYADPAGLRAVIDGRNLDPNTLLPKGPNWKPAQVNRLPGVDDPCVKKFLIDRYGSIGGFMATIGNVQQFMPSTNSDSLSAIQEALYIADEKIMVTKIPVAAGNAIMRAVPGNLAIGHVTGRGLAWLGGLSTGVVEVVGLGLTTFGSVALGQAQYACSCNQ